MTGQEQDVGSPSALSAPTDRLAVADFRQLFELSYQPLVAYARRRSATDADADDLVGEVYATAWRRRDQLDNTVSPLPWLYGIAGNVLRNQRRSTVRRLRLVDHKRSAVKCLGGEPGNLLGIVADGVITRRPRSHRG